MFRIQVLGHFAVQNGSERPKSVPRLVARIGCVLAGWPGEWVNRDRLIHELWGDRPPRTATNTLQAHVSQLRKLVGKDCLIGDTNGYLLDVEPTTVDAELFQETLSEAARAQRQMHLSRAMSLIDEALKLWSGTPYADSNDSDLRARRVRLEELRTVALEDRLECQLEIARDQHELNLVVAGARELVSLCPSRERRHVLLIKALTTANQMTEANTALEAALNQSRFVSAAEPSEEIIKLTEILRKGSPNSLPPARQLRPKMDLNFRIVHLPTDDFIVKRVTELLVEHDAPVVILQANINSHDRLAAYLVQCLQGDFPLGIITTRAEESDNQVPPLQRGSLRIITEATAAQISQGANMTLHAAGATLVITNATPPQSLKPITIKALPSTEEPMLRTS